MYQLARALLFQAPPEASHEMAISALRGFGFAPGSIAPYAATPVCCCGLTFANKIGLAAGLDKDARAVEGLARLGFGFVEVGTVTPRAQPGNPRPRLFRLVRDEALINRMGFNNRGLEPMAIELEGVRRRGRLNGTLLGANLGKNKDTPLQHADEDYALGIKRLAPLVDYFTLNLSSPNTPGLRELQTGDALVRLVARAKDEQARLPRAVPIFIKVAPDLDDEEIELIATTLVEHEVDGLIATNTTVSRPTLATRIEQDGGLSGRPLRHLSRSVIGKFRRALPDEFPIVGVGGIDSVQAGQSMLDAGANLLQIYTSFIYKGPKLVRELARL